MQYSILRDEPVLTRYREFMFIRSATNAVAGAGRTHFFRGGPVPYGCNADILRGRQRRRHEMKTRKRQPQIVLRNGKPAAVILGLDEYEELLERAEDAADLKTLRAMRKKPLRFRKLEDVLDGARRV